MMIKISIIMATLNSERFVYQAIKSILNQEIEELEQEFVDKIFKDKTNETLSINFTYFVF